ncbi:MAG: enoyl-CoA hydratase/isomerase family protein [Gemmobacter sp.]
MSDAPVLTTREGPVATVTVNRPRQLNALNAAVLAGLTETLADLTADRGVRVIVLTGAGDRSFIAGADIGEFIGATPEDALNLGARIRRVTALLTGAPQPVVARIGGFCFGGGLELALACDIRIAADSAKLGLPEIKLGILPGGGGTVRLTQIAGSSVARAMTLTGEPIDAPRAHALGLVASIHAPEALDGATLALTARLAALPRFALAQLKASLNTAVSTETEAALSFEVQAFAQCFSHPDQDEGARAFLEKRPARFAE